MPTAPKSGVEAAAAPDEAVDELVEAAGNKLKLGDTSGKHIQVHLDTDQVEHLPRFCPCGHRPGGGRDQGWQSR